jgi:hypothetical protein
MQKLISISKIKILERKDEYNKNTPERDEELL